MGWRRAFRRSAHVPALRRSLEDPQAYAEFYDLYIDELTGFFASRTFDAELTLDLVAETFATALRVRDQFRGADDDAQRAWLFSIARTQINRYWRRLKVERENLDALGISELAMQPDDLERVARAIDAAGLRNRLSAAVRGLPEDQRKAVLDRVLGEREYSEMAQEYGVSQDVVRARVSRGLRALEAELERAQPT